MTDDEATRTRTILISSAVMTHQTKELDITALCNAGIIDMSRWTAADHAAARAWAASKDPAAEPPPKLRDYFDAVRAMGPN